MPQALLQGDAVHFLQKRLFFLLALNKRN
jgi:hypothetical protein